MERSNGIPMEIFRLFQDGMQAGLQNDGEFSEPFEVTNGVKHPLHCKGFSHFVHFFVFVILPFETLTKWLILNNWP